MDSLKSERSLLGENRKTEYKVLRREWLSVSGTKLCYTLGETQNGELLMSVGSEIECESVFVFNKSEALDFFELLVRNTVTPCTLHDVFEDIFEE